MDAFYDWIAQIILLILLATVLELLLPNNKFQKYVKMVVGLMILLALLSPVMKLFEVTPDEVFHQFSKNQASSQLKSSIKMKKKEIESVQRAYKSNIMAVQMKKLVQEELIDRYDVAIKKEGIALVPGENRKAPVKHVTVSLMPATGVDQNHDKATPSIEPVNTITVEQISFDKSPSQQKGQATQNFATSKKITQFLAEAWQIDVAKVDIRMEGAN